MRIMRIKSPHTIARRQHALGAQSPKAAKSKSEPVLLHGPVFQEYLAPIWGVVQVYGSYSFARMVGLKVARGAGNMSWADAHEALDAQRASRPEILASEAFWDAFMS